jgi:hypothetical protein
MRAFVRLREVLENNRELARKFSELEKRVGKHDEKFDTIIEAIRQLMAPPEKPRREIGFHVREKAPAIERAIFNQPYETRNHRLIGFKGLLGIRRRGNEAIHRNSLLPRLGRSYLSVGKPARSAKSHSTESGCH